MKSFRFLNLWIAIAMLLSLFSVGPAAAQPQAQDTVPTVALRLSPQAFKDAPDLAARRVIDYGSFVWVEVPVDRLALLAERNIPYQPAETTIGVYGYRFDPLLSEPAVPANLRAENSDKPGLQLVQFVGPTSDAWLSGLQNTGLKVLQYYAHNAYLVWGTRDQLGKATKESSVRWSGAFHPAFKLGLTPSEYAGEIENVAVTFYNDGNLDDTIKALSQLGKVVQYWATQPDKAFYTAVLILDAARITDVARLPTVWAVEYSSPRPGLDDENANQIVAGNVPGGTPTTGYYDWLVAKGVDGSGVSWADVDTGLNAAHPDVAGRVAACVSTYGGGDACVDTDGHGSHTAGAIMGNGRTGTGITDPNGFYWGTGMAPNATLVVQNALMGPNWPPTGGWNVLSRDSVLNGAQGSNNSWYTGSYNNSYTAACREHDLMVRDAVFTTTTTAEPIIYVFSVGNGGPDYSTLSEPHAAKNPIMVGASSNYPRSAATINDMAYFSSRGPAADGRTLPTITAPGYQTVSLNGSSANCGTAVAGAGSAYYNYCSGTSMASPQVAGASALIVDWWRQDFGETPSPAMVKALLVNGAEDQNGGNRAAGGSGGVLGSIPNNDVGWGRVNLNNVIRSGVLSFYVDQNTLLGSTGETWQTNLMVSDPTKPVKCSLVWTDAAGAAGANPALVNDLNLTVQNGGNTYLGNVFSGGWSITGGSADALNNIENVFLPAGANGSVQITVSAVNIAGDGVPYNGDVTDQDFALVCYNLSQEGIGWLEGTVYDDSGSPATTPLNGARIQATGLTPTHTAGTISGADGFYRLGLLTDTYTVTTSFYGYYPAEIGGVSLISGTTTTLNIPLTMAPWYVVSGAVTDAATGWPLYASIEIADYPYGAVWNNPVTGWYSVSLPAGMTHTLTARAWVSGYQPGSAQINLSGDATLNITLNANIATCNAPGYNLNVNTLWANSFEGATGGAFPADGWDQVDTSGTAGEWTAPTSGTYPTTLPHSGSRMAKFNSFNASSSNSTRLYRTVGIDLSGQSSVTVAFWMYHDTNYTSADRIQVQISTDGGTTWNDVGAAINRYDGSTGWKQHNVDISTYTGGSYTDVRVALHAFSAYGSNMYVDDIEIAVISCTPLPGGLVVGNVYDENTMTPMVGATVSNDSGRSFAATSTPDDPAVDDAFYTLFSPTGSHVFTATLAGYGAAVQNVTVVVSGTVRADMYLSAGQLSITPPALHASAEMGSSVTLPLTLENTGGASLDFELQEKDRGWAPVLATGGPDAFGYIYADSDQADGPVYQWIDITATGAPITFTAGGTLDDGYGGPFDIGFPFNFYGTDQTQFYASTNGLLTFGAGSTSLANQCPLPSTTSPNNLIALLWDDLDFNTSGNAYYQQLTPCPYGDWNTCTVVEYANVMHFNGAAGSAGTWEAVFFPNGSLLIQFQDAGVETGSSSTTGIENGSGTAGLAYGSCNVAGSLKNNLAVCYAYPGEKANCTVPNVPWLAESPITGTLTALAEQVVDVTLDAGVPEITQPGEYYAQIKVLNNTPYGTSIVPVTFTVTAPTTWGKLEGAVTSLGRCDANPTPLPDATVWIETSTGMTTTLLTNASGGYSYWIDQTDAPVTVTVSAAGHISETITGININGQATTTLDVILRALLPCAEVNPASLDVTVTSGRALTVPLTLSNLGAGMLSFEIKEISGTTTALNVQIADTPVILGTSSSAHLAETGTATGVTVPAQPAIGKMPEDIGAAWESMASLPVGRAFNAVIADADGHIYVIGGTSDADGNTKTNTNYRYNTASNTWDTMAAVPAALDSIDGVLINNKIYIPGDGATATTYVYDIATNTWSTIAANGGYTARSQYQAVCIDTDIYVLGGIVGSASTTEVWRLDTTTGTWSAGVPMQKSRTAFSAAAIDGVIYVAGGVVFPGFTPDMTAEKFDGTAWSYIASLPNGGGAYTRWSYNADAHGADGLWLAAGRRDADWNVLNHAGYYDPETNTWTDSPTIPMLTQEQVYMEGDVATDGYLYVIGGRDSAASVIYATNERLYVGYAGYTPDIEWLSESPVAGTVSANSTLNVDVTFTALPTMTVGVYTATLVFKTNDVKINVPVTMTITSLPACGFDTSSPDYLGETTVFTNTSVDALTYQWDLGDGSPFSTDINPTHQYAAVGSYTITLTATNTAGDSVCTGVVVIEEPPCQPVDGIDLSITTSAPDPGDPVAFSVALTPANLTTPYHYVVDYGDGTVITATDSANPLALTHTYDAAGSYTVTVSVWNCGMTVPLTDQVVVTVASFKVYLPIVLR